MNGSGKRFFSKIFSRFKHPITSYQKTLEKHPIIVQSIQTACLYGTSDLIAQTFCEYRSLNEINVKRTVVFVTTGAFFTGPAVSLWYRFLAKKIGTSSTPVVVKKVLIDQLMFAPCFHIFLITIINTLHGRDLRFIKEQIRLKYFDIISTSIKLWPAVQLINFRFVPTNYQVLVGQVVALFWNVYISWKTQHGIVKQEVPTLKKN